MSVVEEREARAVPWRAALRDPSTPDQTRYLFPQTRAVEIRLPADFCSSDAARLAWQVRRAGFNSILLSCFHNGRTISALDVMRAHKFPTPRSFSRSEDPAAAVLKAAGREDLTVYALVEALRVGDERDRRGPILHRRPEWAVRGRGGLGRASRPPYLCPVNRDVRRFLGDLCCELLEGYPFHGLYLRHLHFPLDPAQPSCDYCRCDVCRRAAWRSLGVKIHEIPDDPDHPDRYNLTSWRGNQLAALVRHLRLRVSKTCAPSLVLAEARLGAAPDEERPESLGFVDASAWAQEQLIPVEVLRPLPGVFEESQQWVKRVAAMAQRALVMPVLSATPDGQLLEIVERFSAEPVAGVIVREPHDLTAPPLIRLPLGPWRERTRVAETQPLRSVCALLFRTAQLLPLDDPVRAFLSDVLRVVEPLGENWTSVQRQTLFDNLLGLEEQIADERIPLGQAAAPVVRNFRLARQLLRLVDVES